MISSPLMDKPYSRLVPDYDAYRARSIPGVGSASATGGELGAGIKTPVDADAPEILDAVG